MQTKKDRIYQLKEEAKVYKELDKIMDAGWNEFVKNQHNRNRVSNERLYRIMALVKGQRFSTDVRNLMIDIKQENGLLELVKTPVGMEIGDSRYKSIPKIWIFQKSGSIYGSNTSQGSMCIPFTKDRWIKINYLLLK